MIRAAFLAVPLAAVFAGAVLYDHRHVTITGPAIVVDGDSLRVKGQRIRLFGIDAPEIEQSCTFVTGASWACGRESRDMLVRFIGVDPVSCREQDRDRYGRMVASCTVRGEDINRAMVRDGMALAYTRYSAKYLGDQDKAKAEKRGMWAGAFADPEKWRHRRRP